MKNKILKTELVEWQKLELFQPDDLKRQTKNQKEKLKTSLKNNGFSSPFYVWETKNKIYCLDGHHRIPAMKEMIVEGVKIPEQLPANFIDCKNKKEAKKIILVFNSHYSDIFYRALNFVADGFVSKNILFLLKKGTEKRIKNDGKR